MVSQQVIIHCRAAPNGTIVEIGERPQALSPHEWSDILISRESELAPQTRA